MEIVGDASKLPDQLEREANKALRQLDLDTKPLSKQIVDAFAKGADGGSAAMKELGDDANQVFKNLSRDAERAFDSLGSDARIAAAEVVDSLDTGLSGVSNVISHELGSALPAAINSADVLGTATGEAFSAAVDSSVNGTGSEAAREIVTEFIGSLEAASAAVRAAAARLSQAAADGLSSRKQSASRAGALFATSFRTAALAGTAALTAGLTTLAGLGLSAAGNLEQTQISLNSLTGSAANGAKVFKDLQTFAAETPFEFPDVTKVAQQFLAFSSSVGLSQKDLIPFLTTLGDVASVTGAGAEGMQRVTLALGQIASAGRLTIGDVRQVATNLPGFNAVAAIAAARGTTTAQAMEDISSGAISADEGIRALIAGMKKFPGAAGAMEKQSETLLGVLSTFKDVSRQALSDSFAPVIPQIKESLAAITPIVGETFRQLAPALGGLVATLLPFLVNLLKGLTPILVPILQSLSAALEVIGPLLPPLGVAFAQIISELVPVLPLFSSLLSLIFPLIPALLQLAVPLAQLLIPALSLLETVLVPLIPPLTQLANILAVGLTAAVGLVYNALGKLTLFFTDTPAEVYVLVGAIAAFTIGINATAIATKIAAVATDIWTASTKALGLALKFSGSWVGIVLIALTALVTGFIYAYKHSEAFRNAVAAVGHALEVAGKAIVDALLTAVNAVGDGFGAVVDFVSKLPGRVGGFLSDLGEGIVDALAAIPGLILAGLKLAFDTALRVIGIYLGLILAAIMGVPRLIVYEFFALPGQLATLFTAVGTAILAGATAVGSTLLGFFTGVGHSILTFVDEALAYIASMPEKIGTFLANLPAVLVSAFTSAFVAARNAVSTGIGNVVGLAASIPDKLGALKNRLLQVGKDLISGFFSGLTNVGTFVGDIAGKIVDGIKSGINYVIDKINVGLDDVDDFLPFDLPKIPRLARGGLTQGTGLAVLHPTEAVLPLEDTRTTDLLARAIADANASLRNAGTQTVSGTGDVYLWLQIGDEPIQNAVATAMDEHNRQLRVRVMASAGRPRG